MGPNFVFFTDDAIKNIIETLEPGVHDFVPFELRYCTEDNYKTFPYYFARPMQTIPAIDVENSDVEWIQRVTDGSWVWDKKRGDPFALKPDMIAGKHLWRYHGTFISDEFHDEIQRRGLTTAWLFERQLLT